MTEDELRKLDDGSLLTYSLNLNESEDNTAVINIITERGLNKMPEGWFNKE